MGYNRGIIPLGIPELCHANGTAYACHPFQYMYFPLISYVMEVNHWSAPSASGESAAKK